MRNPLQRLSPQAYSWAMFGIWVVLALVMAIGVVTFVGRSFVVHGSSMEPTLHSGEIVFTNKLGKTLATLQGKNFLPSRNALAVFNNPFYNQGDPDMFIVKRIVGLPGDRVVVRDGRITVYPDGDLAKGLNPDEGVTGPQSPTSGSVDRVVPEGEVFVAGDNRLGKNSLDSRNGMSTVPAKEIQGVIVLRLWPLNAWGAF